MKFSLCIEPVFENLPFYERFRMAKDCGCDAVEFWDPWVGSEAVTPAGLGKASSDAGIPVAACCLNQAWTIRMNFPWKTVKANVERSIAIGKEFGCKTFIGLSGDLEGSFEDTQKLVLLENLKRTAEIAEKEGVTIVLEALNSMDDNNISNNIDFIGHFHSAGVPGRHELQLGETNYPMVIKAAEDGGYDRYFGFEYWPTYSNEKSLKDILAYVK